MCEYEENKLLKAEIERLREQIKQLQRAKRLWMEFAAHELGAEYCSVQGPE